MKKYILILMFSYLPCFVLAKVVSELSNPRAGVLCDKYICADQNGLSIPLTKKFLGSKKAKHITAQGEFDTSQFTFSNGVFCDVKVKLCYVNRYYENGERSKVSEKYTHLLFISKNQ